MCDYSLMEYQNRLASEGEVLIVHRFNSGSLGLASPQDCCRTESKPVQTITFWSSLKEFFSPSVVQSVSAVCIPPGASLILHNVPADIQKALSVGPEEEVTFVQLSAAAQTYRDAVRFRAGQTVRLQDLREGQRVEVVDLGNDSLEEPAISDIAERIPVVVSRRF